MPMEPHHDNEINDAMPEWVKTLRALVQESRTGTDEPSEVANCRRRRSAQN